MTANPKLSNIVLVAGSVVLLSGCVSGTIAGAALSGGTWWAGKEYDKSVEKRELAEEKHRYLAREHAKWQMDKVQLGRIKKEVTVEGLVSSDINRKLLSDLTRIVSIRTKVESGGIVTLTGNVPSREVERRAVAIVKAHPSVKQVVSNLNIVEVRIMSSKLPPKRQRIRGLETNTGRFEDEFGTK